MTFSKTFSVRLLIVLFSLFLIACNEETQAGADEGLYAPKAPENAAFIRVLNVGSETVTAKAGDKDYGAVAPLSASSYYFFTKDNADITVGDKTAKQSLKAGAYYTAIIGNDLKVIEDTASTNPAKAILAFYNHSNNIVSVKAKENTASIFNEVAAGDMTAREINPVKVDLTLNITGNDTPMPTQEIIMERENHYGVVYNGEKVFVVTAIVDTTK